MLAKEIYVSAVGFSPFGFRCSIFLLTLRLPLSRIHCCLDTSPLKVIKKSLPSWAQRLCLWKQVFENRVRKITLSVKTLLLTYKDNSPALPHACLSALLLSVCVHVCMCVWRGVGVFLVFLDPQLLGCLPDGTLHVARRFHGCGGHTSVALSLASRGCMRS